MLTLVMAAALFGGAAADTGRQETPVAQASAPAAFNGRARLTSALAKVREVAFRSAEVDWTALESELGPRADRAGGPGDMLPIYRDLLSALGDEHSFVQADPALVEAYVVQAGQPLYAPKAGARRSVFSGRSVSTAQDVALGAARARIVVVPAMSGGGAKAAEAADRLFDAVTGPGEVCGYVVDLRGNTGGNVWPMLLGLNPLLGDGDYGIERDRTGRDAAYARIADGAAIVLEGEHKDMAMVRAGHWRRVDATTAPVALLIDGLTASSGEGVAVAFQGRPNTRTFGETTYGVASSNLGVPVEDDINLVVTVAMMVDRQGHIYPQGIAPDTVADAHATREAALVWLQAQPGCAP